MSLRPLLAALTSAFLSTSALAAPPPSVKPPAPPSPYVTRADEAALRDLFDALDRRRYAAAADRRRDVASTGARALAEWAYLRSGAEGIEPETYAAFLAEHGDWPQVTTIQAKAEAALEGARTERVLAFFEARDPVSGPGMITLGRALMASGSVEAGEDLIRRAWVERNWDAAEERQILSEFGASLRELDHVAKADRQLFDIRATVTERILPLLPERERAMARARIAFLKADSNAPGLYDLLPEGDRSDAGVLHAATRYYRRRDDDRLATVFAGRAPVDGAALRDPEAWARERMLLARTALTEGRFRDAYVLTAYSGLERGADFADAEFFAGWIALRFLNEPERARAHFARLAANVTSPISQSRGRYWLARAEEAAGETGRAEAAYRAAAGFPFTYYGQLAAEALGQPGPVFPEPAPPSADGLTAFEAKPLVEAMRAAAEIGEDWAFDTLARALDDQLQTENDVRAYADLVIGERKTHLAVRAGKVARAGGSVAPEVVYPLIPLPEAVGRFVEEPLVLGLSRQESEFNERAYSSARAHGLMQLIGSTAQITARKEGLPYRQDWLMDDPSYNLTLGAAHLRHLLDRFEGSYVMVLAGYNAGPHRVSQWIETYGDPRSGAVDPVDWIELIPFSETRNYVQRVLENTQVYRARLGGGPIAGRLVDDIVRGGASADAIGQPVPAPRLVQVSATAEPGNALRQPDVEPVAMAAYRAAALTGDVPVPTVKPSEVDG